MNALVLAAFVALAPPGSVFRAAAEGWSAQFPAGWMSRAENGVVVAGHNTEAGLLVLRFELGATRDTLAANAAQGIAADGAVLALRAPARTITLKAHGAGADAAAVAAEFDGFAADGSVLAASAIGVVGKAGAVTVLGVTSPQQLPALTARILAVASSVAFFAPKRAPAAAPAAAASGAVGALRGALCAYSGGSTMSTTTRANFDGAGHVSLGSESAMGGTLSDQGGNQTGWYAGNNGNQYDPSSSGTYSVRGDTVEWRGHRVQRAHAAGQRRHHRAQV